MVGGGRVFCAEELPTNGASARAVAINKGSVLKRVRTEQTAAQLGLRAARGPRSLSGE